MGTVLLLILLAAVAFTAGWAVCACTFAWWAVENERKQAWQMGVGRYQANERTGQRSFVYGARAQPTGTPPAP